MTGNSRRVDVSRMHDPCEGLVVCDEYEAGVPGTLSVKCRLISAFPRRRMLLGSDLTAVAVSVRYEGVGGKANRGT